MGLAMCLRLRRIRRQSLRMLPRLSRPSGSRTVSSPEFPRDIESQVPVVVRRTAPREVRNGGGNPVGHIDLNHVAPHEFFEANSHMIDVRIITRDTGDHLADKVHRATNPQPRAETQQKRIVTIDELRRQWIRIVDPDWLRVHRAEASDPARDNDAERGGIAVTEIVGAVDRRKKTDAQRSRRRLLLEVVLRKELDRPIVGAIDARLHAAHDAESVFEANLGSRIQPEEIRGETPETARPQRTPESMRDAKRALELRKPERGWQRGEREFRLTLGLRPTSVWQCLHAARPEASVVSKISLWMLVNVG